MFYEPISFMMSNLKCDGKNGNHRLNPALCWTGGKTRLKNRIIEIINKHPHDIYIEPFFGGGSVFFAKPLANKNIINDKNPELMWFYRNLRDTNCSNLQHCNLPKNEKEFNNAVAKRKQSICAFLGVNKRSYSCNMEKPNFSEAIAKDKIRGKVGIENIKKSCNKYQEKLRRTKILNEDYKNIINRYKNNKNNFFYIDPPYVDTYDYGQKKVNPEDVCRLAKQIKGKVVLSYNDHKRVRNACKGLKFREIQTSYTIQKSQTNGKDKKVTELLITNF